jgi:hypothetical protein
MAKVTDLYAPLKKNEKVIATRDLPGVPAGTKGKVKLWAGFNRPGSWARYWVFFENGVELGSVPGDTLVRAKLWDRHLAEQERLEREGPALVAASPTAAASGAEDAAPSDGGAGSRIPAHLLEWSKNRRKALGLS